MFLALEGLRPISHLNLASCQRSEGEALELLEGGAYDLVVKLKDEPHKFYYINRGLKNSFGLQAVKNWKNQQQVRIWYVDRWAWRALENKTWHIARLDIDGTTVFDETGQ